VKEAPQALTLDEVARIAGGRLAGDPARYVRRIAPLDEAGPDDLSMLAHPRYRKAAAASRAGALLVKRGLELESRDQVVVDDPHLALVVLLPALASAPSVPPAGVSPRAEVAASARLGRDVGIGPLAVVGEGCVIGDGARLGAGCVIGEGSEIGAGSILHPNTTIYPGCTVGRGVIVHSGTVVGSDGFGYVAQGGRHLKIPQAGSVVIEDEVEIGACVTIDRGSIGDTVIGRGTKIDNLVQIGHNVRIGAGCLIVAQTGISGSTRIGAGTVFAGQSGAAGHLNVGSGVVVASKSAVYKDLPDGAFVAGIPAMDHRDWKKSQAIVQRLPGIRAAQARMAARLAALEAGEGKDEGEGKGKGRGQGKGKRAAGSRSVRGRREHR
jgi:UDP-3-O-[3-hydroxymyristoyl] glucosamine N-acyltransferase